MALPWKMEWHRGSLCFASPPPTSSLNPGVLTEQSGSLLLSNLLSLSPQAPHFPPGSDLLLKAASIYHSFLTWPVPYCDTFRELLTFISNELKAPGEGSCPAPGARNPALPRGPNPALPGAVPAPKLALPWGHRTQLCSGDQTQPYPGLCWHQTYLCPGHRSQPCPRLCQHQTQPCPGLHPGHQTQPCPGFVPLLLLSHFPLASWVLGEQCPSQTSAFPGGQDPALPPPSGWCSRVVQHRVRPDSSG